MRRRSPAVLLVSLLTPEAPNQSAYRHNTSGSSNRDGEGGHCAGSTTAVTTTKTTTAVARSSPSASSSPSSAVRPQRHTLLSSSASPPSRGCATLASAAVLHARRHGSGVARARKLSKEAEKKAEATPTPHTAETTDATADEAPPTKKQKRTRKSARSSAAAAAATVSASVGGGSGKADKKSRIGSASSSAPSPSPSSNFNSTQLEDIDIDGSGAVEAGGGGDGGMPQSQSSEREDVTETFPTDALRSVTAGDAEVHTQEGDQNNDGDEQKEKEGEEASWESTGVESMADAELANEGTAPDTSIPPTEPADHTATPATGEFSSERTPFLFDARQRAQEEARLQERMDAMLPLLHRLFLSQAAQLSGGPPSSSSSSTSPPPPSLHLVTVDAAETGAASQASEEEKEAAARAEARRAVAPPPAHGRSAAVTTGATTYLDTILDVRDGTPRPPSALSAPRGSGKKSRKKGDGAGSTAADGDALLLERFAQLAAMTLRQGAAQPGGGMAAAGLPSAHVSAPSHVDAAYAALQVLSQPRSPAVAIAAKRQLPLQLLCASLGALCDATSRGGGRLHDPREAARSLREALGAAGGATWRQRAFLQQRLDAAAATRDTVPLPLETRDGEEERVGEGGGASGAERPLVKETLPSVLERVILELLMAQHLLQSPQRGEQQQQEEEAEEGETRRRQKWRRELGQALLLEVVVEGSYSLHRPASPRAGGAVQVRLRGLGRLLAHALETVNAALRRETTTDVGAGGSDGDGHVSDGDGEEMIGASPHQHQQRPMSPAARRNAQHLRGLVARVMQLYAAVLPDLVDAATAAAASSRAGRGEDASAAAVCAGLVAVREAYAAVSARLRVSGGTVAAVWWLGAAPFFMDAYAGLAERRLRRLQGHPNSHDSSPSGTRDGGRLIDIDIDGDSEADMGAAAADAASPAGECERLALEEAARGVAVCLRYKAGPLEEGSGGRRSHRAGSGGGGGGAAEGGDGSGDDAAPLRPPQRARGKRSMFYDSDDGDGVLRRGGGDGKSNSAGKVGAASSRFVSRGSAVFAPNSVSGGSGSATAALGGEDDEASALVRVFVLSSDAVPVLAQRYHISPGGARDDALEGVWLRLTAALTRLQAALLNPEDCAGAVSAARAELLRRLPPTALPAAARVVSSLAAALLRVEAESGGVGEAETGRLPPRLGRAFQRQRGSVRAALVMGAQQLTQVSGGGAAGQTAAAPGTLLVGPTGAAAAAAWAAMSGGDGGAGAAAGAADAPRWAALSAALSHQALSEVRVSHARAVRRPGLLPRSADAALSVLERAARQRWPLSLRARQLLATLALTNLGRVLGRSRHEAATQRSRQWAAGCAARLTRLLASDPALLAACACPSFLDAFYEAHLRLRTPREEVVAFGYAHLLPLVVPLIARSLSEAAAAAAEHTTSAHAPHGGEGEENTAEGGNAALRRGAAHADLCEQALLVLSQVARYTGRLYLDTDTPDAAAAQRRYEAECAAQDALALLSMYCVRHTRRGGLRALPQHGLPAPTLPALQLPATIDPKHVAEIESAFFAADGGSSPAGAYISFLYFSNDALTTARVHTGMTAAMDGAIQSLAAYQKRFESTAAFGAFIRTLEATAAAAAAADGMSPGAEAGPASGGRTKKHNATSTAVEASRAAAAAEWARQLQPARAAGAAATPFFASSARPASSLGYLLQFMEHYFRHLERLSRAESDKEGSGGGSHRGDGASQPAPLRTSEEEGWRRQQAVSAALSPLVVLDMAGELVGGGGWPMLGWTFSLAETAVRYELKRQRAGADAVRASAVAAVLAHMACIPPPPPFGRHLAMIPTGTTNLGDALADPVAPTLLGRERQSPLAGFFAAPTRDQYRAIVFAIRQAVLYAHEASQHYSGGGGGVARAGANADAGGADANTNTDSGTETETEEEVPYSYFTHSPRDARLRTEANSHLRYYINTLVCTTDCCLDALVHHVLLRTALEDGLRRVLLASLESLLRLFTACLEAFLALSDAERLQEFADERAELLWGALSTAATLGSTRHRDQGGVIFGGRNKEALRRFLEATTRLAECSTTPHPRSPTSLDTAPLLTPSPAHFPLAFTLVKGAQLLTSDPQSSLRVAARLGLWQRQRYISLGTVVCGLATFVSVGGAVAPAVNDVFLTVWRALQGELAASRAYLQGTTRKGQRGKRNAAESDPERSIPVASAAELGVGLAALAELASGAGDDSASATATATPPSMLLPYSCDQQEGLRSVRPVDMALLEQDQQRRHQHHHHEHPQDEGHTALEDALLDNEGGAAARARGGGAADFQAARSPSASYVAVEESELDVREAIADAALSDDDIIDAVIALAQHAIHALGGRSQFAAAASTQSRHLLRLYLRRVLPLFEHYSVLQIARRPQAESLFASLGLIMGAGDAAAAADPLVGGLDGEDGEDGGGSGTSADTHDAGLLMPSEDGSGDAEEEEASATAATAATAAAAQQRGGRLRRRQREDAAAVAADSARLWRLLADKWEAELLRPHDALFEKQHAELLERVRTAAAVASSSSGGSAGEAERLDMFAAREGPVSRAVRQRRRVVSAATAAGSDAIATADLPTHADPRVPAEEEDEGEGEGDARAPVSALRPAVLPPLLPLDVLFTILKALPHGDPQQPELARLAALVAAYVSRHYLYLRPRLSGTAVNVIPVLDASHTAATAAAAGEKEERRARERLMRRLRLPPQPGPEVAACYGRCFTPAEVRRLQAHFFGPVAAETHHSRRKPRQKNDAAAATTTTPAVPMEETVYRYLCSAALYLHLVRALAITLFHYELVGDLGPAPQQLLRREVLAQAQLQRRRARGGGDTSNKNKNSNKVRDADDADAEGLMGRRQMEAAVVRGIWERQTTPAQAERNPLEHALLHMLNVGVTLLRHCDALSHAAVDAELSRLCADEESPTSAARGGKNKQQRKQQQQQQQQEGKDREEGESAAARVRFADEARRVVVTVLQDTIGACATAMQRSRVTTGRRLLHALLRQDTCDGLTPHDVARSWRQAQGGGGAAAAAAEKGKSSSGKRTSAEGGDAAAAAAVAAAAARLARWRPDLLLTSPALLRLLSPAFFLRTVSPLLAGAAAPTFTPVAGALTYHLAEATGDRAEALLAASTELLRHAGVAGGGNSAVRLYADALARALVDRPELRRTLAPPLLLSAGRGVAYESGGAVSPAAAAAAAAAAVPNEVLLPFVAVMASREVHLADARLATLLTTLMELRADVFGQPPTASRQGRLTLRAAERGGRAPPLLPGNPLYPGAAGATGDTANAAGNNSEEEGDGADDSDDHAGGDDDLADAFAPLEALGAAGLAAEAAAASHRAALASLNLPLPVVFDLALSCVLLRRPTHEQRVRAHAIIRAADSARRERVAAFYSSAGASASASSSSSSLGAAAQAQVDAGLHTRDASALTAGGKGAATTAAADGASAVSVSAEGGEASISTNNSGGGGGGDAARGAPHIGVALLHLRYALRKVVHASVRRQSGHQPPAMLAAMAQMLAELEPALRTHTDSGDGAHSLQRPLGSATGPVAAALQRYDSTYNSGSSSSASVPPSLPDPILAGTLRALLAASCRASLAVGYAGSGAPLMLSTGRTPHGDEAPQPLFLPPRHRAEHERRQRQLLQGRAAEGDDEAEEREEKDSAEGREEGASLPAEAAVDAALEQNEREAAAAVAAAAARMPFIARARIRQSLQHMRSVRAAEDRRRAAYSEKLRLRHQEYL